MYAFRLIAITLLAVVLLAPTFLSAQPIPPNVRLNTDTSPFLQNEEQVWFTVGANTHPGRDTVFCEGPTYEGDHAAPVMGMGHKLGIDATRKLAAEGHDRGWPDALQFSRETTDLIDRRWTEYGL